jgi:hypothetical protein
LGDRLIAAPIDSLWQSGLADTSPWRPERFYAEMAATEQRLRADPVARHKYERERDAWLNPDQSAT